MWYFLVSQVLVVGVVALVLPWVMMMMMMMAGKGWVDDLDTLVPLRFLFTFY